MKKIVLFISAFALGLMLAEAHAEGEIINPATTPSKTISCNYPNERTDDTALAQSEIAFVSLYAGADKAALVNVDSNSSACSFTINTTLLANGQYYYALSATDSDGRESVLSFELDPTEYIAWVIERPVLAPKPPTFQRVSGGAPPL